MRNPQDELVFWVHNTVKTISEGQPGMKIGKKPDSTVYFIPVGDWRTITFRDMEDHSEIEVPIRSGEAVVFRERTSGVNQAILLRVSHCGDEVDGVASGPDIEEAVDVVIKAFRTWKRSRRVKSIKDALARLKREVQA